MPVALLGRVNGVLLAETMSRRVEHFERERWLLGQPIQPRQCLRDVLAEVLVDEPAD